MSIHADGATDREGGVALHGSGRESHLIQEVDEVRPMRARFCSHQTRRGVITYLIKVAHVNYEPIGRYSVSSHRVFGASYGHLESVFVCE